MELTDEQITILQLIHDSGEHCIDGRDMYSLKIDYPSIEEELQPLIAEDFVEYVTAENKYYLAYEGFGYLEQKSKPKRIAHKSEIEQYQEIVSSFGGIKQFHKMTVIGVMIITFVVSILLYLNSENVSGNKNDFRNVFDESTINQMKLDLEEARDSVRKLK